jgi:CRP/FNR family cyclic AMP-dependent transcriptional regulator
VFRRRSDQRFTALQGVSLFASLTDRQLECLDGIMDEIDSAPGEVLVRQGELGRELIVVQSGALRVERNGSEVGRIGPGEVVGEMALLDGEPRSATVIVDEPSHLFIVHRQSFDKLLDTVPGMQRQLLVTLSRRLREYQSRLAD